MSLPTGSATPNTRGPSSSNPEAVCPHLPLQTRSSSAETSQGRRGVETRKRGSDQPAPRARALVLSEENAFPSCSSLDSEISLHTSNGCKSHKAPGGLPVGTPQSKRRVARHGLSPVGLPILHVPTRLLLSPIYLKVLRLHRML